MKVSEVVIEAGPPGTSSGAAFVGRVKKKMSDIGSGLTAEKEKWFGTQKDKLAKQNQKKWYDTVKRKQKSNVNMNDETEYRNALKQFLTGAGKVQISATLQQMIQSLPLTDQNILKIMTKTIDDRQAYKNKLANAPKVTSTAQPTPQSGATP